MRCRKAIGIALVATLLPLASASLAHAQDSGRVVVRPFSGKYSSRARGVVVESLGEHGIELVPNGDATSKAQEIGAELGTSEGYAQVAREMDIKAFVEGRLQRGRRGWRVQLRVRDGESGEVVHEDSLVSRTAGGLARKMRRGSWSVLSEGLDSARAPEASSTPSEAPEPQAAAEAAADDAEEASEPTEEAADEAEGDAAGGGAGEMEALRAMVGVQVFSRKMTYNDDILGGLREYSLGLGPAAAAQVRWYPGAHFTDGIGAAVGFTGRFAHSFGLKSTPSRSDGNTSYETSSMMYELGVRGRHRIGIAELHLDVGYGKHQFSIGDGGQQTGLPNTSYGYVRAGGGSAFDVTERIGLDVHLAYLHLTSLGELGTDPWFPRASGGGLLAQVGMDIGLGAGFSVRVQGEMQRYFFSLNPEPGDPHVAGGLVDQYFSGTAGIAWSH